MAKLTKGRSGMPGSGLPSDWSILTDFVNTRALLKQMTYAIWRPSETFKRVRSVQICYKQHAKRFPQVKSLREKQKDCIKVWSMEDDFAIFLAGFLKS